MLSLFHVPAAGKRRRHSTLTGLERQQSLININVPRVLLELNPAANLKSKLFKLETGEAGGQGGQGFISDITRLQKIPGHSFNDFKKDFCLKDRNIISGNF